MSGPFIIKQGDTSPSIAYTLYRPDGVTAEILTGSTVKFVMASEDSIGTAKVKADAVVVDAITGEVRYDWATGDTDTFGGFVAEWEVTRADGSIETFPNGGYVPIAIIQQAG